MRKHRVALITIYFVAAVVAAVTFLTPASGVSHTQEASWKSSAPLGTQKTMLLTPQSLYPLAVFASAVEDNQAAQAFATAEAALAAQRQATTRTAPSTATTYQPTPSASQNDTGGLSFGLFPCIIQAESGGNASDHSGLYGDLDSTWAGYDGYPYAGAAPVSVQNAFNLALYQRDGWAPWNDSCTGR
jgi:hypothetical protein